MSKLKESYSVTQVCKAFGVHRSTYNYHRAAATKINSERLKLNALVKSAHNLSNGSAGARTIADIVTGFGLPLSRYRAKGVMKQLGLDSTQLPKHRYKKASKANSIIANKLDRQFSPVSPNQAWCGDVTYLWTGQRWSYFAVVLGLYARKPVGWALSNSPDSNLTAKALTMAFESRGRPESLMFHSDQGSHYTSIRFRQHLWHYQIEQGIPSSGTEVSRR